MTATDEALRRELAEVVGAGFGHIPFWTVATSLELADALIAGPIAKHTAALEAKASKLDGLAREALTEAEGAIADALAWKSECLEGRARIAALQADVARLEAEIGRLSFTDERGAVWKPVPAWTYFALYKRAEALEAENAALRAAPGAEAMRDALREIIEDGTTEAQATIGPWQEGWDACCAHHADIAIRALSLPPEPPRQSLSDAQEGRM